MESNKRSALLLSLIDKLRSNDSWSGETHIQKATYFLQTMAGVDLGLDFILYKHGPFSFDLRDELSSMRANQLVELVASPPYGPQIRPTDLGSDLVERFPKTIQRHEQALDFVSEKLGPRNVAELERLATALLLIRESPDPEESAAKLSSIKPHIGATVARDAVEEVRRWSDSYLPA